ncbi:MAG: hypothetical protein J3R72DRAFT_102509 [Linnemannia gamsii]|nr:MAG: hypothetical protein J3R72DRAFT_102509 [Linnemannia gamsii]
MFPLFSLSVCSLHVACCLFIIEPLSVRLLCIRPLFDALTIETPSSSYTFFRSSIRPSIQTSIRRVDPVRTPARSPFIVCSIDLSTASKRIACFES